MATAISRRGVRLRTFLLLPVIAAPLIILADWLVLRPLAEEWQRQVWHASYLHARRLGPPSAKIIAERDRLLIQADRAIRADLIELASRYPQLMNTNHGLLPATLARSGPHDWAPLLSVGAQHYEGMGGEAPDTLPPEQWFNLTAYAFEHHHQIVDPPPTQMVWGVLFPHLYLWGGRTATAGDPGLQRELEDILDRRLAPLDKLEAELARQPIPASGT